jgi:NAD(P)-dependent dehydrogenase (short-subunit alcohol dehydrogenase family)
MTRTAIITGGARGIGRGTVQHFLGLGWRVAALDKDREALAELKALQPDTALMTVACDVAREAPVRAAFARIVGWQDREGAEGIDLLVNNAGRADPDSGPIERLSLQDWQSWLDASLTAAFLCARSAIPLLRPRRGNIVNIASTRARQSEPDTEAYAAAKGGLVALTHALAISLGPEIRVNAILPGWIDTGPWQKEAERTPPERRPIDHDQHPVGRIGLPRDVAGAIEWLASDAAGFVTGQSLVVDGGMSVKMIYAA